MKSWDVYKPELCKTASSIPENKLRKLIAAGKVVAKDWLRETGTQKWSPADENEIFKSAKNMAAVPAGADPNSLVLPDSAPPNPSAVPTPRPAEASPVAAADPYAMTPPPPKPKRTKSAAKLLPPLEDEEDEFHWKKRHMEVEEFDLTPMVDMTFLLNMFFIMTTSYGLLRSLDMHPPTKAESNTTKRAARSLEEYKDTSIILKVTAENQILIDDEPISKDELTARLKKIRRETGRDEVLIQADELAHHETVVAAQDSAYGADLIKVHLAVVKQE